MHSCVLGFGNLVVEMTGGILNLERVDRRCVFETGRSAEFGRRYVLLILPQTCADKQCDIDSRVDIFARSDG